MAVASVVLLLSGYVSAWLAVSRSDKYGIDIDHERLVPVFDPVIRYADSDLPGATALSDLWWSINPEGVTSHSWPLTYLGPGKPPPFVRNSPPEM
jgi:hypothetical protein